MIEKFTKALQRMQDVMIPIYNFISAIADLNINF
ncbi:tail length tape measure protein [Bacillus tropicus]